MEDIRFNCIKDVDDYFDRLSILGSGAESICYRNKRMVCKRYNELYRDLYNNDIAINNLLKFRNIIIENI